MVVVSVDVAVAQRGTNRPKTRLKQEFLVRIWKSPTRKSADSLSLDDSERTDGQTYSLQTNETYKELERDVF